MIRRSLLIAAAFAGFALTSAVSGQPAPATPPATPAAPTPAATPAPTAALAATAKDLVGAWSLVGVLVIEGAKKTEQFGPAPKGQLAFDGNGRFTIVVTRADLPKYAAKVRAKGTADEMKATVQGSVAYFGSYTVEGSDIVYKVEGSTFANWIGETQKRTFKLTGDDLVYSNTPTPGGPTAELTWKRVK